MLRQKFKAGKRNTKSTIRLIIATACLSWLVFTGVGQSISAESVVSVSIILNPLKVSISAPEIMILDRTYEIQTTIQNLGDINISNVYASIYLPANIKLLSSKKPEDTGTVTPHTTIVVCWPVKAIKEGQYIVDTSVSCRYTNTVIVSDDTCVIKAVNKPNKK